MNACTHHALACSAARGAARPGRPRGHGRRQTRGRRPCLDRFGRAFARGRARFARRVTPIAARAPRPIKRGVSASPRSTPSCSSTSWSSPTASSRPSPGRRTPPRSRSRSCSRRSTSSKLDPKRVSARGRARPCRQAAGRCQGDGRRCSGPMRSAGFLPTFSTPWP